MTEITEYKVILIGNSAVGKTSFFKKIITGEFSEKNISTIGIDRRSFQIDIDVTEQEKKITKTLDISLIDTAGQERFKSITKTYYTQADCILLIYDITNRDSYDNVKSWINSIHESIGNHENSKYIIVLIGNKVDLIGVDGKVRMVTEEEAKLKCEEFKIIWGGECSVKTYTDIDLKNLIKEYMVKYYEKFGPKIIKQQVSKKLATKKKKKKGCFI